MLPAESASCCSIILGALNTPVRTPEIKKPTFASKLNGPTVRRSTGAPSEATTFIEARLPATLTKQISTFAVSLSVTVNTNPMLAINAINAITPIIGSQIASMPIYSMNGNLILSKRSEQNFENFTVRSLF